MSGTAPPAPPRPRRRFAALHGRIERRALVFVLAIFGVSAVGGLVEIAPKVMKPFQPSAPEWTWLTVHSV